MKHHFVPRFTLRYWADNDGEVPTFSRQGGRIVCDHYAPSAIARETDLYAFKHVPPEQMHIVETEFFSKLDNDAAPIYAKLERANCRRLALMPAEFGRHSCVPHTSACQTRSRW